MPVNRAGPFATLQIVGRLIAFGFSMSWAQNVRRDSPAQIAQRARAFLEDLGGLWVKAGQFMSLRTDILTVEMADELSKLQYQAFGFDPTISRQVIEQTLGRPIEDVFDRFEAHPFAAASISQEHRAHLRRENVSVVLKVRRPGIQEIFERDFKLISVLLRLFGLLPAVSHMDFNVMLREMRQMMDEELDYHYEMGNLKRMRKKLRAHKVYVPKLFADYSGQQLIVMEEIFGTVMSDYLRIERSDPERVAAWCRENNIKPYKVGSRLLQSFYRQVFEDNIFHGDLHPGNIILLTNSRFALIDVGTIGNLDSGFLTLYRDMGRAVAMGDYARSVDYYLLMCEQMPVLDIATLRTEMVEVYRHWEARSSRYGLSYREKAISGTLAFDLDNVIRKYHIMPGWQMLRVGRAITTLDANLASLLQDADPIKVIKRYYRDAAARSLAQAGKQIGPTVSSSIATFSEIVKYTSDSLRLGAIQFEGVQSTARKVIAMILRAVNTVLFFALIFVGYDFVHDDINSDFLTRFIDPWLGAFSRLMDGIFPDGFPREFSAAILILILILFMTTWNIHKQFAKRPVRHPNGRMEI
jgi:ubiquinone biosynthesis protein